MQINKLSLMGFLGAVFLPLLVACNTGESGFDITTWQGETFFSTTTAGTTEVLVTGRSYEGQFHLSLRFGDISSPTDPITLLSESFPTTGDDHMEFTTPNSTSKFLPQFTQHDLQTGNSSGISGSDFTNISISIVADNSFTLMYTFQGGTPQILNFSKKP